jgi:C-terminal processing protease CtpA/Prc
VTPWTLRRLACLSVLVLAAPSAVAQDEIDYVADVEFALDEIEADCRELLRIKEVDWEDVRKEFGKAVKKVDSDEEFLELLVRLIARVRDGHAEVRPQGRAKEIPWPTFGKKELTGCGLFLFENGKKVYVRNAWGAAAGVGLAPGMEILKVDKQPITKWLDRRVEYWRSRYSFSTDQHAFFWVCHRGMMDEVGARLDFEYKDLKGKKKKRTVTYSKNSQTPWGPAVFPKGLEGTKDLNYGLLESGHGYVHVRRCKGDVVSQLDDVMPTIAKAPGVVLDFRANSGGGFDHAAFLGRFVPKGEKLQFKSTIPSAGSVVYGGPIVVIVNGTTVSAGETGSGQFKEEGRAYLIGESPTAGMSSQKTTIDLPSGLFQLYVSTHSNKGWYNDGRGLEGVGLIPHEIVELDPEDVAAGVDTLIERAVELLGDLPAKEVPYQPEKFGWGG